MKYKDLDFGYKEHSTWKYLDSGLRKCLHQEDVSALSSLAFHSISMKFSLQFMFQGFCQTLRIFISFSTCRSGFPSKYRAEDFSPMKNIILFQTLKCKEMFQNCLWWYDTDFQFLLLEILIQWVKYEVGNLFSEYLPMIQGMSYKILTSRAYRKWAYHDKV